MHRRESLYGPDAEEFRPERWETGELDNIGFGYLQFHGGPRICLGSKFVFLEYIPNSYAFSEDFALMEASYALVRVLQEFPNIQLAPEIVPVKTGQEKQEVTIVVSSAEGCKVLLG
jgi:cytochrome P450